MFSTHQTKAPQSHAPLNRISRDSNINERRQDKGKLSNDGTQHLPRVSVVDDIYIVQHQAILNMLWIKHEPTWKNIFRLTYITINAHRILPLNIIKRKRIYR